MQDDKDTIKTRLSGVLNALDNETGAVDHNLLINLKQIAILLMCQAEREVMQDAEIFINRVKTLESRVWAAIKKDINPDYLE